jgi:glycosyltransferase involved in cell wall biosynthesis
VRPELSQPARAPKRNVPKTILICSNVYPPNFIGGAEIIAHYQAKSLQEIGHEVIVFTGDSAHNGTRYTMRQHIYEGLPVFRVPLKSQDYSWDFVNFSHVPVEKHFDALLDVFSPDVVHMHNIVGLSLGIIHSAKRRGVRTVVTLHDHWGFCFKNTLIKKENEICQDYSRCAECMPTLADGADRNIPIRMRRDFFRFQLSEVDSFISPSSYLAETYVRAGVPIGKMNLIWYGIDVARFSSVIKKPNLGRIRFTFIGYFGSHKGIPVMLEALMLIRSPERISVNLVGGGELNDYAHQRVEAAGLQSVVRFWGKVDHTRIEEVFSETDVLILPSIWPENQPVTITEAMATRTAVIASEIGGIPELVTSGYNGYLFQPGSAKDLAEKMSEFINYPERINLFGENGFQKIKDKTLRRQVEQICTVYG